MVNWDLGVISETQSMTSHPEGTEVTVKVVGPASLPTPVKSMRARARALASAGVIDSSTDAVANALFDQDIQRLTYIDGDPINRRNPSFIRDLVPVGMLDKFGIDGMEASLYTVIVRDN